MSSLVVRLVPIMLLNLPFMLWNNASEFCLLCSVCKPVSSTNSTFPFFYPNHEYQQFLFIFQILCNCNLVRSPTV